MTGLACPQGCTETDPMGRTMEHREEPTGETVIIDTPHGPVRTDRITRYLQCPVCGHTIDQ